MRELITPWVKNLNSLVRPNSTCEIVSAVLSAYKFFEMETVRKHDTDSPEDRLKTFEKLMYQVKRYRDVTSVDPHLQAITILDLCADIALKKFSATKEQMLETVKLFGEYTPMNPETQVSIALKLCNKLCINVT